MTDKPVQKNISIILSALSALTLIGVTLFPLQIYFVENNACGINYNVSQIQEAVFSNISNGCSVQMYNNVIEGVTYNNVNPENGAFVGFAGCAGEASNYNVTITNIQEVKNSIEQIQSNFDQNCSNYKYMGLIISFLSICILIFYVKRKKLQFNL